MAVATKLWTVEDLEELEDDGFVYELLYGEVVRMSPPGTPHYLAVGNVFGPLRRHVDDHDLGIVSNNGGFILQRDPDVEVVPDIAFVRHDRIPDEIWQHGKAELAPDLVVEVVSPSDTAEHVETKVQAYLSAGTALVVLVWLTTHRVTLQYPDGSVQRLFEGDVIDLGAVVPGFTMEVSAIFKIPRRRRRAERHQEES